MQLESEEVSTGSLDSPQNLKELTLVRSVCCNQMIARDSVGSPEMIARDSVGSPDMIAWDSVGSPDNCKHTLYQSEWPPGLHCREQAPVDRLASANSTIWHCVQVTIIYLFLSAVGHLYQASLLPTKCVYSNI